MIYNELRPTKLSQLVGQEVIKKTLGDALKSDKVPHSMLFIGVRGTGKTTTARIVAKKLNCLSPMDGEPCGCCDNCATIEKGSSFDVHEMDAAANRGVADMDELLESVHTVPLMKKKVFIIDEVHMLTKEASNRLLKVLEEPPENVHFILCTTEIMKVLPTIRSRCAMFNFKAIDEVTIATELSRVCDDRGVSYQLEALYVVAKAARGSMRDALSLLEPLMEQGVTLEVANDMLGLMDDSVVLQLLGAVCTKDITVTREIIDSMVETGRGVDMILDSLLSALVDMLSIKLAGGAVDSIANTQQYKETLRSYSSGISTEEVIELTDELKKVRSAVGKDANAKLGLLCALMTHIYRKEKQDELLALKTEVAELRALITNASYQNSVNVVSQPVASTVPESISAQPATAFSNEVPPINKTNNEVCQAKSVEDPYLSMLNGMMATTVNDGGGAGDGFVEISDSNKIPFDTEAGMDVATETGKAVESSGMSPDMMEIFRNSGLPLEEPVFIGASESEPVPATPAKEIVPAKEQGVVSGGETSENEVAEEKKEESSNDVVNVGFMSSFLGGFGGGFNFFK